MPDYQLLLSILGLLVMVYGAHHQRKQTNLMESQVLSRAARRRGEIPRLIWWKSPAIWVLSILMILNWGPYILSTINNDLVIQNKTFGISSGTVDLGSHKFTDLGLRVTVDGNEIYKYSPWRVMAVAFIWTPDKDVNDVQELQKSTAFDIRKDEMVFLFKGSPKLVDQFNKGAPINYAVIILPKNLTPDSFVTLRQAKELGARIFEIGSQ
jgi:hypothetical protein